MPTTKARHVTVPVLDCDKNTFREDNVSVHSRMRLERRVVAGLISHLADAGFVLHSVFDGDTVTKVSTTKEAMELIFDLDEASLRVAHKDTPKDWHPIYIVLGNYGYDAVSDWNYFAEDRDGFDKAMTAFNGEDYIL